MVTLSYNYFFNRGVIMIFDSNKILNLLTGIVAEIDLKNKIIRVAYQDGKEICSNINGEDFLNLIFTKNNVKKSLVSLDEITNWLFNSREDAIMCFDYEDDANEKARIRMNKTYDAENNIALCLIKKLDKEYLYSINDPMTNLYQKETFSSLVSDALVNAKNRPFYFLIIDIDDFKRVNDQHGHLFGDKVIKDIATLLKTEFKNGYVCRYGGDEFSVLSFDNAEYDAVWKKLHEVCAKVHELKEEHYPNCDVSITIGCSRFGIDGENYTELFLKADKALYRGKSKGKNCFIIYKEELHKNISVNYTVDERSYLNNTSICLQLFVDLYDVLSRKYRFDTILSKVAEIFGRFFIVDRALIFLKSENDEYDLAASYVNPTIEHCSLNYVEKKLTNLSMWDEHIVNDNCQMGYVGNIEKINPTLYEYLLKQNVISVYLVPLKKDRKTIGYLRLDTCKDRRKWTTKEGEIITQSAKIVGIFIARTLMK